MPSPAPRLYIGLTAMLAVWSGVKAQTQQPSPDQNAGEVTTHDTPATFRTKVNLVLVPVVVRDKQGRVIGDLRQEDFQLFDRGKLQTISSFSVETLESLSKLSATPESPAESLDRLSSVSTE